MFGNRKLVNRESPSSARPLADESVLAAFAKDTGPAAKAIQELLKSPSKAAAEKEAEDFAEANAKSLECLRRIRTGSGGDPCKMRHEQIHHNSEMIATVKAPAEIKAKAPHTMSLSDMTNGSRSDFFSPGPGMTAMTEGMVS